jgi:hypothetical protein
MPVSKSQCEENLRKFQVTVSVMGRQPTTAEALEAQTERLALDSLPHGYVVRSERELREHGCQD